MKKFGLILLAILIYGIELFVIFKTSILPSIFNYWLDNVSAFFTSAFWIRLVNDYFDFIIVPIMCLAMFLFGIILFIWWRANKDDAAKLGGIYYLLIGLMPLILIFYQFIFWVIIFPILALLLIVICIGGPIFLIRS